MDLSNTETQGENTSNFPVNTDDNQRQVRGRKRNLTSNVWNHFTIAEDGNDGKERGICNYCRREYTIGTSTHGTSTLRRHLLVCKEKPQRPADREGGIDYGYVRYLISMCIIKHDLPFAFVEYEGVRDFFISLRADFELISKETAIADVCEFYEAQKEDLKLSLTRIPSRVCLTLDIWTSITTETYICLAARYVDEDWNLNDKILSFCWIYEPHSSTEFAERILGCLKDWGIEKKILSLTLDNSLANENVQNKLKEKLSLQDSLLCNGAFFDLRCCSHMLDVIAQEGLKLVGDVLHKIRECVVYIRRSEERKKLFQKCMQQAGIQSEVSFQLDEADQWDSSYMMLRGAVTYQCAFNRVQLIDENFEYCPSGAEWSKGEKLCKFLKPLFDMARLISGSRYSTSNLFFMKIWKIGCLLRESMENEDGLLQDFARRMHVEFTEYWDQFSGVLAMGAVFDPRIKFEMLKHCYDKIEPSSCKEKLEDVKRNLYLLFEHYKSISTTGASSGESSQENNLSFSADELLAYGEQQEGKKGGKSLLDVYLEEEARLPMLHYKDMEVLEYWRRHRNKYGMLAFMACDLLTLPITTAASESSFSAGARSLSKFRSRVLCRPVLAKLCVRNWLLGYAPPDNDNVDDEVGPFPGLNGDASEAERGE